MGLDELAELGVRRVSTGSLLFRAALHATVTTAIAVRDGEALPAGIPSYTDIDALTC
jgi:2-methylisocitrate lyase-like PEP mutase family enzyme